MAPPPAARPPTPHPGPQGQVDHGESYGIPSTTTGWPAPSAASSDPITTPRTTRSLPTSPPARKTAGGSTYMARAVRSARASSTKQLTLPLHSTKRSGYRRHSTALQLAPTASVVVIDNGHPRSRRCRGKTFRDPPFNLGHQRTAPGSASSPRSLWRRLSQGSPTSTI